MTDDAHFKALERMYLAAPVNAFYRPTIEVADGRSTIAIDVSEKLFHAAGAVHGSVYFKLLDDAAFFAANSLEREVFVLTTSFTTYLTRPVTGGRMSAVGRVVQRTRAQFIAEAVVSNDGEEVGRGNGVFVRGKSRLESAMGYGGPAGA